MERLPLVVYCPIKEQEVQECDATDDYLKYWRWGHAQHPAKKNITQLVLQIRDIYEM